MKISEKFSLLSGDNESSDFFVFKGHLENYLKFFSGDKENNGENNDMKHQEPINGVCVR